METGCADLKPASPQPSGACPHSRMRRARHHWDASRCSMRGRRAVLQQLPGLPSGARRFAYPKDRHCYWCFAAAVAAGRIGAAEAGSWSGWVLRQGARGRRLPGRVGPRPGSRGGAIGG